MRPTRIPIPTNAGKVERWWYTIRGLTLEQVPLESALSFPIPVFHTDKLCFAIFYYGIVRTGDHQNSRAAPPIAKIVATYPDGRLLVFEHRKAIEIFPGLPTNGDLGRAGSAIPMSPSEVMRARQELFNLYETIVSHYSRELPVQDERRSFLVLFLKLAEPGLIPYYQALNPEFYHWLTES